jgi:hypothetical protein
VPVSVNLRAFRFMSHLAFLYSILMVIVYPVIYTIGVSDRSLGNMVSMLAENNALSNSTADCDYLRNAVSAWVEATSQPTTDYKISAQGKAYETPVLLWAQVLPVRCDWQQVSGVVTACPVSLLNVSQCQFWAKSSPLDPSIASPEYFANLIGSRVLGIIYYTRLSKNIPVDFGLGVADFQVKVIMDQGDAISIT